MPPQRPVTRSGGPRSTTIPIAAVGPDPSAVTAPTAGTTLSADTGGSQASLKPKTPTKAALFDSLFGPDSGDDEELPCGQKDNLARI